MDREQVHETVNRLVEGELDRRELMERLGRFEQTHDPPPKGPSEFENLAAFLDFYEAKRKHETERQSLQNQRDEAEEAYNQAERMLQSILPENTPLHYHYEGNRQELAGQQFTIVNEHLSGVSSHVTIRRSL
jgi:hypothetical protein